MFQDQDYNGNYDQLQTNKQSIIHLRNYKLWLTSLKTKFKINLVYGIITPQLWFNYYKWMCDKSLDLERKISRTVLYCYVKENILSKIVLP